GLCDPGYEADEEFNRLSDDSEERKLLMENKLALDNPVDFAVDKVKGIFDAVLSIPEAIGKSIEKHSKNYDQKSLLTRSPQMIVPPRPRPTGSSGLAKISGGQVIDINDKNQLLSSVVTDGFIEIYNPLKKEVRLDGYELRDHTGNVILSFPSGSSIAPEQYQVIAFSPLFEENFGIKPDYVFDGFSVDKFKGTVVLAYNGQEGFKYVDYVRYGEKSKPMYISGDTSPVKQRFIPINLEEEKEIIISEISIDYGNQLAFIEIVNVGKKDYILNNHNIVVYAGENYYSGDINNMVLKPGETFIFEFGVSGQASEINEDWICPGEVENGVCLSVPVAKDTKAVSINDLENVIQASHSGLMPRVEVALSKRVCTPECKTEVIEHFLKELDSVPYSGIKSYKVSEQKIFRGSKERSEDFVEDISPSLGFIEAFENRVVADIISPGWKSKKSLLTGAAITDTIRSEVSMLSGSSIETSPAFSSAPIPEMPAVYESYKQEDLSIEDLEQAKLEYFEYPCGTILRLNEEKGDKKQKKKSIRQKIDDFDVDKELADILNKLKQDGIDVDNPDVFKKQLGNIHVRLVERLFESVWESDFFIENYKSDHRALISSFFSYDLKKELEDIPIVQFEHRFDWKEKLIFLNDFRLREDFLNLNIEEKLFDINRALYYRLGYDYRVYSTVYSPLSAHWFAVKFGGVPSQDWNNKRIGVNEDIFDLIIRGIGNIFSFPVYVNGFARAWNNLDKVETSMNELLYKDKEIDAVMSIIEKYPSEVSPGETLGMFGISPEESSEEYEDKYGIDFDTLVETCLAARNALSGANRQGFGEPIVSFQRIDMKEGNEFKQGPRTVITRETPPSPYFTGSVVSEILEYDDFVSSIKDNRISDLVSEKNVLQENLRKGIDVEDSKEKIYSIDKEITALDSSFKRDMNVLEDTLPDINALELRSPQDVKVDSLTDMNSEYSSEENDEVCEQGACGANKCWKECEDLHLLLTEIFPGTVVMFPE
ncbi:lamin tail domain-containing protein, partial [Candidatus Woesearchaeota archaeon]|nr:lamin tail domain-containing protein [Candidatus Woesearchaeota archaeon]